MAIDGDVEDVPDTPANVAFFGRHRGGRGDSAFPQTRAVYLCESGSHTICDAGFWPCHTSERVGGLRMLRSVEESMLVMWDCGFHSFDMAVQTRQRKAHFLGRLPAHVKPKFVEALPDTHSAPPKRRGCGVVRLRAQSCASFAERCARISLQLLVVRTCQRHPKSCGEGLSTSGV